MKADHGQDISVVNAETENITNLRKALEVEIKCSKSVHDKLKDYLKQQDLEYNFAQDKAAC